MSNQVGKRLAPALRFPEFRGAPEWLEKPLEDLISIITLPKKIPTTDYLAEGLFPIAAQTKKIEALKVHKQGLMQQLFPTSEELAA